MNQPQSKVQPPAIFLIITGVLNGLIGALGLFGGVLQIAAGASRQVFRSEAERFGFFAGQFGTVFVSALSLLAAPFVVYGAIKMLNGTSHQWAKAAAILVIVPVTSCCFLLGIPMGIWALVVLSRPDVKMFFEQGGANYQPPPPPPQYYQPM